jgi:hypothetical protein
MTFPYNANGTDVILIYINDLLTSKYPERRSFEYKLATLKLKDINLVRVSSEPRGKNQASAL